MAIVAEEVSGRDRMQFFHWELEFPDVFGPQRSGFDAVLGNPPWDVAKPNSKEFFSNIDPLYRAYGKQEALEYQQRYFADPAVETAWERYNDDFKAQSNFAGNAANPFGDPEAGVGDSYSIASGKKNGDLHTEWRRRRAGAKGYADAAHAFRHQGSADVNLYKLFLEQAHALLREGGRLGFIVPSGLYSDHGTGDLRRLFLNACTWEWLFGFENRDQIFDIHRSYKFNAVIVSKGGETESIRTAFMRRKLEEWEQAEGFVTPYTREQVGRFSPHSKAILEIQSMRDLEVLEKMYASSVLLGDGGPDSWAFKYSTEFHMTSDSKLFPPRSAWEAQGYRPDEYSRWLKGDWRPVAELWPELGIDPWKIVPTGPECERHTAGHDVQRTSGRIRCAPAPYDSLPIPRADIPGGLILSRDADAWIREAEIGDVALPLMQGAMVWHFDFVAAAHQSGAGQKVRWRPLHFGEKLSQPQFLMSAQTFRERIQLTKDKLGFRGLSNPTNRRTWIGAVLPDWPCGNMLPVLRFGVDQPLAPLLFSAIANSYSYDYEVRKRFVGGTGAVAITISALEETAVPRPSRIPDSFAVVAARLNLVGASMADAWLRLGAAMQGNSFVRSWGVMQAVTPHERLRLAGMADAIAACLLGLNYADLNSVLAGCDHPLGPSHTVSGAALDQKGFWRVDSEKEPEIRHTVLTLVAFADLAEKIVAAGGEHEAGMEAFISQNDGEGWLLPETLRLADYGLGHDERAQHPQPVASRLGPRFYDWQLAQTREESWRECELHARNLATLPASTPASAPLPPLTNALPKSSSLFQPDGDG